MKIVRKNRRIQYITKLDVLMLAVQVTMAMALNMLRNMSQLERLNLSVRTVFTDSGLIFLSKCLPHLQHLQVSLHSLPLAFVYSVTGFATHRLYTIDANKYYTSIFEIAQLFILPHRKQRLSMHNIYGF